MNLDGLRGSYLSALVIEAYADPDPMRSLEEFERLRHDDLPRLTIEEIDRERGAARLRWIYDPDPSRWLIDRIERLDRERERRLARRR